MFKQASRAALAGAVAIAGCFVAPSSAQAVTPKCRIVNSTTVGGYGWARLRTKRVCANTLQAGVAGSAQLSKRTITVHYSEKRTTNRELQMATVHELAHEVEFWTTDAARTKLYAHLGIRNHPSFYGFNDAYYYNGTMAAWRKSPRERLAESVVQCTYGRTNHSGLALVPRKNCTVFLRDFRAALSVTR